MARTATGTERINFHIQPDVLAALKRIAAVRSTTYSELIRLACRQFVLEHGRAAVKELETLEQMGRT